MHTNLKRALIVGSGVLALAMSGCESTGDRVENKRGYNEAMMAHHFDSPSERAVIQQQTLYGYHFVPNGSALNTLGENDMDVLIAHYKAYPGSLNIQRGDADGQLYQQRVDLVRNMMLDAGIDGTRLTIREGLPGGSGVDSARGSMINERANEQRSSTSGMNSAASSNTWR